MRNLLKTEFWKMIFSELSIEKISENFWWKSAEKSCKKWLRMSISIKQEKLGFTRKCDFFFLFSKAYIYEERPIVMPIVWDDGVGLMDEMMYAAIRTALQVSYTVLFFMVGAMLLGRKVQPEYKRPTFFFGLWWTIAGVIAAVQIIQQVLFRYPMFQGNLLATAYGVILWSAMMVGIFGLLYYMLFLFTGKEKWTIPLAVFYAAATALVLYVIISSGPYVVKAAGILYQGTTNERWYNVGEIAYTTYPSYSMLILLACAVLLPIIIVAIALYALYFRLDRPTQKYRVLMIATGMLLWFGSGMTGNAAGVSQGQLYSTIMAGTSLVSSLMIYLAYKPPKFVKKRGILSIDDETPKSAKSGGD